MDFGAIFSGLPAACAVIDADLVVVEVNQAYLALVGRSREELVGRRLFAQFPPTAGALDDAGQNPLQASLERVRDTGETDVVPLHRYDLVDEVGDTVEERYWSVINTAVPAGDGGTPLIVQQVEDVTEYVREHEGRGVELAHGLGWHKQTQAMEADVFARVQQVQAAQESARKATSALRASEQLARAVLDTAVDAIITIDPAGRIQSVNQATEAMFGYRAAEMVGQNVCMLMPDPDRSRHEDYLERYNRTGERRIIGLDREVSGQSRDGRTFPIELAVSEVGSDPPLFTGVVRDITDRKRLEAQLLHHSMHDALTGLANRALLTERLELASARLQRRPGLLALFFVDLDRFKLVNDTLGHDVGDELLKEVAVRLRTTVRPEDLVARLGGDEFVILCEDLTDTTEAQAVARRLVKALNSTQFLRGREVHVAASVGVVTDSGQRSSEALLTDADAAMYQAKAQGRGGFSVMTDNARSQTNDRLQLRGELHHALDREELRATFQPVVRLGTGEVVGAEALLRWQHPRRGVLAPAAFLDLADDTGLSASFDRWMLLEACKRAAGWTREMGRPVGIWVNLSSRSLADPQLRDTVAHAVEESRLDPGLLTLEITEGGLMQDAASTVRALVRLRELGVELTIDDFGTGYSSLAYLQQFPVTSLKIDRSFIGRLDQAEREARESAAIVQAIVSLAASLGRRTVAEGIETPEQLTAVTALGCDLGQGYYLGRPVPSDVIPFALKNGVVLTPGLDSLVTRAPATAE